MESPVFINPNDKIRQLVYGRGEMSQRILEFDWSKTAVGSVDAWPQSLLTMLGVILNSSFPMLLLWGEDMVLFYNDAYRPSLGQNGKHPEAFGQNAHLHWSEVWHIAYPLLQKVRTTGQPHFSEDQLVPIFRNGKIEDAYWTYSYSAVIGETGKIDGVLVVCNETTKNVNTLTEFKQTQKQLGESENNLRSIILKAPVAMCLFKGPGHVIELANERMLAFWGKSGDQVLNKPVFESLLEVKDQNLINILDLVYSTGKTYSTFGLPLTIPGNGQFEIAYVNFICEAFKDVDGFITGVMAVAIDVTEEVIAKQQLVKNEEQLRLAIEGADLGLYDFYPQTGKLIWSVKTKELYGLPPDAAVDYSTFMKAVHPEDQDRTHAAIQKALQPESGGLYEVEYRVIVIGDGRLRWLRSKGKIEFEGGKAVRLAGVTQDITERKNAEQDLRMVKEQLEITFQSTPIAICLFSKKGEILFANDNAAHLGGYKTSKEFVAERDLSVIKITASQIYEILTEKGETLPLDQTPTSITLRTGKAAEGIFLFITKYDRTKIWVLSKSTPIFDGNGEISMILTSATDITLQKTAEEDIRNSEQRFRTLAETLPQLIWITNKDGEQEYTSNRWKEYTGIEPTGLDTWKQTVHPDDFPGIAQAWVESTAKGIIYKSEARLKSKTGEYRWHFVHGEPIRNESGEIIKWIGAFSDVHDQKETEAILRYRKALLEAHNESSVDGILLVDAKGKIISYNQRFIEIWNMPRQILNAKDDEAALLFGMTQLVNPQQFIEKVKWLYEHPTDTYVDELEFKDGKIIERYGYPVVGEDGTYYAWSWTFRDVTKQKMNERTIRESEERFRSLANSIPQLAWMTDAKGWKYWYNQRWYDYTGSKFEEMQGWGWQAVHHPDLVRGVTERFKKAIEAGKDWEDTLLLRGKDGQFRWFLSRALPIRNAAGEIIQWFGTNTDVSAQRESEERFRNLANQSPMWVWMADEDVNVTYANKELLQFVGILDCSDFTGNVWETVVHPEDVQGIREIFGEAYKDVKPYQLECRFKNAATQNFEWFYIKGVPRYEQNQFSGFVGTGINIQEQKNLTEELERRVLERTKQLEEANQSLANTNKELEQFAYVASHDLQEPLRKIRTFIGLINQRDDSVTEKTRVYLQKITNSSERMMNLIKDLLNHSSIKWAEQSFVPFDLNEILFSIKTDLELLIIQKSAIIISDSLPIIDAIPLQMRQLFFNIINNSLKFSKNSITPKINITCRYLQEEEKNNFSLKKDAAYVFIKFEDNGVGFSQIYAKKIFDIFQRLHDRQVFPGSGIGLALCKKIAENHQGTIYAESKEGDGASFYVILPLEQRKENLTVT